MNFEFIKTLTQSINGINSLFFAFLSAGPTLFWLFICLRFDREAPEPPVQILRIFLWGALITVPIIFIASPLTNLVKKSFAANQILLIFTLSFLIDGLIEESAKCGVLCARVYHSPHFNELRDGFVYGMTLGLGLAFIENILYGVVIGDLVAGGATVLLRGVTTTFMHFLSGGIIGYHLGLARFRPPLTSHNASHLKKCMAGKWGIILRGLALAILFHGFYNTIVRFEWVWGLIPLTVLLVGAFLTILREIRKTYAVVVSPPVPRAQPR